MKYAFYCFWLLVNSPSTRTAFKLHIYQVFFSSCTTYSTCGVMEVEILPDFKLFFQSRKEIIFSRVTEEKRRSKFLWKCFYYPFGNCHFNIERIFVSFLMAMNDLFNKSSRWFLMSPTTTLYLYSISH